MSHLLRRRTSRPNQPLQESPKVTGRAQNAWLLLTFEYCPSPEQARGQQTRFLSATDIQTPFYFNTEGTRLLEK